MRSTISSVGLSARVAARSSPELLSSLLLLCPPRALTRSLASPSSRPSRLTCADILRIVRCRISHRYNLQTINNTIQNKFKYFRICTFYSDKIQPSVSLTKIYNLRYSRISLSTSEREKNSNGYLGLVTLCFIPSCHFFFSQNTFTFYFKNGFDQLHCDFA